MKASRLKAAALRLAPVILAVCALTFVTTVSGQTSSFKVMVFSKTAGFRHSSIPNGIAMVQSLSSTNNFTVDATEDAAQFSDANLAQYNAVIFLCTTGDILDGNQQAAFERYIRTGGGYVGIHSASDTEYNWPWYGQLVGAYFQSHPAIQQGTIEVADGAHPSSAPLPKRWVRTDEWYNFRSNPRGAVHVLATLDEKTYSPGTGAMGHDHPIAWCHEFDGGRAWYTGGGHTEASYSEPLFRLHVLGGILWAAGVAPGDAGATIDSNFQKVVLDPTLSNPMELAVARDGRVFYVERGGRIKTWKPATQGVVVAGQLNVFSDLEDGLLGITLDPGFETNHWLYLFYSPAGAPPEQHVSRFTLNGDTLELGSERILLVIPTQRDQCCHSGGSLTFGPDGDLFISTGDNTNPFESGGYAPIDERPGRSPWDAQKSSANANDLRGKILRIRPQADGTYTIPPGNLFPPGTPNTRPEIYVMGNRNPFRIAVDQQTGWLYWGEVGPDAGSANGTRGPAGHDEWNQARSAGNYGWPYFTGDSKAYNDFVFPSGPSGALFNPAAPINNSPNNTGPQSLPPARPAWIWYPYANSVEFPEVNQGGGRCAMGGPTYHFDAALNSPRKLPRYYDKTVFIYEWSRNWIREVKLDDNRDILKINRFLPSFTFRRPMEMEMGADGAIYMIEWGSSFGGGNTDAQVIRIDYVGGNRAPTVVATATPDAGSIPLAVQFSSAGTTDPDANDTLSYAWSFFSDGTTNSTAPNPAFTYTSPGNYTARLTVTDSFLNTAVADVMISAGNNRPEVTLDAPPNGAFFDWGEALAFSARATDAEDGRTTDGTIPCGSVSVEQFIGHNDHSHSVASTPGCAGIFDAPAGHGGNDDNLYLIVEATYTDEGAPPVSSLVGRATHLLQPKLKQAEHFTASSGVSPYLTADPNGGGLEVRDIDHGDSISFAPMNLTNITALRYRVAATRGGRIEVRVDAANGPVIGTADIPATGGAYADVTGPVADPVGTHELFFVFARNAGDTDLFRLNWIEFVGDGVTLNQTPFGGVPALIPGTIQAENFDEGGAGVSFQDLTLANEGGAYRTTAVDIEAATDTGGGYNIRTAESGEWLEYLVDVATPGVYTMEARVASEGAGGTFLVAFGGADQTGPINVPDTGGWQNWQTLIVTNVVLSPGRQVMRVTMVDNGSSGHVGSFNYFNLAIAVTNVPPMITLTNPPNGGVFSAPATIMTAATASDGDGIGSVAFYANNLLLAADTNSPFSFTWSNVPAGNYTVTARAIDTLGGSATSTPVNISVVNGQAPYRALPIRVPGRVQAEDFDDGGENVAYHDTDSANNGAAYRNTAVDLESTTDGGGGFNVGWTSSGEWLEYSLFADVDGTYRIDVRVAAASPGATFHIDIDGVNTTGARTLPTTGGWQNWATVPISNVGISSGPHLMRFTIDSAVDEGAGGNVNWIRFTATSTNVAAPTLQFATSLPGTFADEADAVVNMSAKTITTRRPTNTRYYRVRATQTSRILGVRLADGNVVLTYE